MEKYPPDPEALSALMAVGRQRTFRCLICDYESKVPRNISNHKRKHNPYNCPDCNFKTISKRKFDLHVEVHSTDAPFQCHKCRFVAAKAKDLIRHRKIHFGNSPYYCSFCQATFESQQKLEEHVRGHVREKPFACQDCHLTFSIESSVIRHQEGNRCSKNFKSFNQSSVIPFVPTARVRKHIYGLDKNLVNFKKCGTTANNDKRGCEGGKRPNQLVLKEKSEILECHNDSGRAVESQNVGIIKLTKYIKIPVLLPMDVLMKLATPPDNGKSTYQYTVPVKNTIRNKCFICNLCSRTFPTTHELGRHIRVHTRERPFACTACSFTTSWKKYLPDHFLRMHSNVVVGQPPEDTKTQKNPSKPSVSTSSQKLERKNKIVCEFCDAKVSTAFQLLDHLRQHTGQTLYKCAYYPCKFKTIDKKLYDNHSFGHGQSANNTKH